ncbi:AbrB/MazE/SpoVT family DNA-binding domain-containing protein (plasmid) [Halorubrum salinarum]|uniref:AbrB/MazE/SpoVT family DNA-binding domain-containing protein n=1 Tax=Halorubrum salinarum TaxID=2739057 RepID=A0A7D4BS66_9EURY|nr:AbrB/MazE/SpoVT family DNA-binding domain-containing protein [Halorubrum salinarum]QKG94317.1 AbrB/MazE/SpoVT family DNA-binding domain-containing protein [Halorubrum salinarum]
MDDGESTETTGFDPDNAELVETVSVSASGDVMLPDQVCETLGLDPPGLVAFHESETGEVFIRRVPSPSEMRGFASRNAAATDDTPASELLRAKRNSEQRDHS